MVRSLLTRVNWSRLRLAAGRQALINVLILALVVIVFGTQLDSLSLSLRVLGKADPWGLAAALLVVMLTFPAAALTYQTLAGAPVRLLPTIQVQVASGFINRLLPIGIGSLGLYVAYFRKQGLATAAAAAVVVTNNVLGIVGNVVLVGVVLTLRPEYIDNLRAPKFTSTLLMALGVVALVGLLVLVISRTHWRDRIAEASGKVLAALRASFQPDRKFVLGLLCNMVLTSLNAIALYCCILAVGGSASWAVALLILSAGMLVGSALPTPGGIGGVEAGLLAGMLVFGLSPATALASVLLYRGLTYWLPIIPGVIMFRHLEKRHFL